MQIKQQENEILRTVEPIFWMHAELCKALGNRHRLAIIYLLRQGEMCVSDLARSIDVSIHSASRHLRLLQEKGLVRSRQQGQAVYYSMTNPKFVQGCTLIRDALIEQHQAAGQSLLAADTIDALARPPGLPVSAGTAPTPASTARPRPTSQDENPEPTMDSQKEREHGNQGT